MRVDKSLRQQLFVKGGQFVGLPRSVSGILLDLLNLFVIEANCVRYAITPLCQRRLADRKLRLRGRARVARERGCEGGWGERGAVKE